MKTMKTRTKPDPTPMVRNWAERYASGESIPDLRALARNAFMAGFLSCAQRITKRAINREKKIKIRSKQA